MNVNKITDTPKLEPDSKTPKVKRGSSKANLQQFTKLKQTTLARRLPIHKNKVGGQPNDHWGLVHNSQLNIIKHKHSRISCITHTPTHPSYNTNIT
jgi:hypothetical protein